MSRFAIWIGLVALAGQGCIIYAEGCESCGWDDGSDWDDDGDCGWGSCDDGVGDDDEDDEDEVPAYTAVLDPAQAELGETFLARLYVGGGLEVQDLEGVDLSGGVNVRYLELRDDAALVLIDVPPTAEVGLVDLTLYHGEIGRIVFPDALLVGEAGSGTSADTCP